MDSRKERLIFGARNGVCAYALQPGGVKTDMSTTVPTGRGWEKGVFLVPRFHPSMSNLNSLTGIALIDDVMLAGGFCVWLTKEKREWLSGRYVDSRWDIEELERKRDEIEKKDLLKFRMAL